MYVCYFLQGEKCFCAKSDKCPTIGESIESVSSDNNKVCLSYCCALVYVIVLLLQDGGSVVGQGKAVPSGDRVSPKKTKVCGVFLCL